MHDLGEKISYLKGLCEGLNIDESKPEGKLLMKIVEVLEEVNYQITDTNDAFDELQSELDEVDEDLAFVEDYLFDDDGDEEDDDFDCEEFECPNCGEVIYLDSDLLEDEEEFITCPACGEKIDLEIDCCCDDCDCNNDEE